MCVCITNTHLFLRKMVMQGSCIQKTDMTILNLKFIHKRGILNQGVRMTP